MHKDNKIYAVIDTNVIVSALYNKNAFSNPTIILEKILKNQIIPVYNHEIIEEYKEVLTRQKFNFPPNAINDVILNIVSNGLEVERQNVLEETFPDSKDIVFYEVRMAVDDSFLVTGNLKHFPIKPFVVSPTQFIEILKQKGIL